MGSFFSALHGSLPDVRFTFSHLPTIVTPRLTLRPMRYRDAKDIFSYASDPDVARYVLWSAHETLGDSLSYIRCMKRLYRWGEPSNFGIVLNSTGKMVGTIGFMSFSDEHSTVEVGYSLAKPLWNCGYMTEALSAFLELCFDSLHIHRVEAMYDCRNVSSGMVMAKCGMKQEGTLRGKVFNKGEFADVNLCAILREDWDSTRRQSCIISLK